MTDIAETGAKTRRDVQGPKSEQLQHGVRELHPELADWVDEFVFGTVWAGEELTTDERVIVAISALAATRNHEQLQAYLFGAVHRGIAPSKLRDVLGMMAVYGGFPVAIQGLTLLKSVVETCRRQGVDVDL